MSPSAPSALDRQALGAAVVTHYPDADFGGRLTAIAREIGPLVVVDNTTGPAAQDGIRELCSALECTYIALGTNRGLAAALNHAFAHLAERGLTWAIAFDQDSTPAAGFGASLMAATTRRGDAISPVIVGANWTDEARPGRPSRHLRRHPVIPLLFQRVVAHHDLATVTCVITSGSLFHLPTLSRLGGFGEELFLDLVDTDYCLRARRAGHAIGVAANARLLHRRGAKRPVPRLGRTWWPAFIPPWRLRELFRNRMRLFRRHGWHAPHWVLFEAIFTTKNLVEIVFLEDRKLAKLAACVRGTWDGLLGRAVVPPPPPAPTR